MQKRVALARALVTDPTIVLFDEPTTGQDPVRRNAILSMIAHYKRKFGFTAVLISHDIPDVFFISDRIVLLWEGKVAYQGTYEEMTGFKHPMTDEFLHSLEGFQDELTGLLSKQMFRARYDATGGMGLMETSVTAVLFSVEFELLAEHLGPRAAAEVMKALGEFVNADLAAPGGFSSRQGHRGVLSIMNSLGTGEFYRVKLGLGRPPEHWAAEDFVLSTFSPEELEEVADLVERGAQAVGLLVAEGLAAAQNRFHRAAREEVTGDA